MLHSQHIPTNASLSTAVIHGGALDSRTLYIGGLRATAKEKDVLEMFDNFQAFIEYARIIPSNVQIDGNKTCICFVVFESKKSALNALSQSPSPCPHRSIVAGSHLVVQLKGKTGRRIFWYPSDIDGNPRSSVIAFSEDSSEDSRLMTFEEYTMSSKRAPRLKSSSDLASSSWESKSSDQESTRSSKSASTSAQTFVSGDRAGISPRKNSSPSSISKPLPNAWGRRSSAPQTDDLLLNSTAPAPLPSMEDFRYEEPVSSAFEPGQIGSSVLPLDQHSLSYLTSSSPPSSLETAVEAAMKMSFSSMQGSVSHAAEGFDGQGLKNMNPSRSAANLRCMPPLGGIRSSTQIDNGSPVPPLYSSTLSPRIQSEPVSANSTPRSVNELDMGVYYRPPGSSLTHPSIMQAISSGYGSFTALSTISSNSLNGDDALSLSSHGTGIDGNTDAFPALVSEHMPSESPVPEDFPQFDENGVTENRSRSSSGFSDSSGFLHSGSSMDFSGSRVGLLAKLSAPKASSTGSRNSSPNRARRGLTGAMYSSASSGVPNLSLGGSPFSFESSPPNSSRCSSDRSSPIVGAQLDDEYLRLHRFGSDIDASNPFRPGNQHSGSTWSELNRFSALHSSTVPSTDLLEPAFSASLPSDLPVPTTKQSSSPPCIESKSPARPKTSTISGSGDLRSHEDASLFPNSTASLAAGGTRSQFAFVERKPSRAFGWSVDEVCEWLSNIEEFSEYAENFRRNLISGDVLQTLTVPILKEELEISPYGVRVRLISAIEELLSET